MGKVYILQDMKGHDYSSAEEYGELVFATDRDLNSRFPIMGTPANRHVIETLFQVLRQFRDGDFLVVAGNPVTLALALQYLSVDRGLNVILLKWDNREMVYNMIEYPGGVFNEIR
jgi:hypothetical protein